MTKKNRVSSMYNIKGSGDTHTSACACACTVVVLILGSTTLFSMKQLMQTETYNKEVKNSTIMTQKKMHPSIVSA